MNKAQSLLSRTVKSFSESTEITEIYSFGSSTLGTSDEYSDVDITVISNDISTTTKQLENILNKIGSVLTVFTIFEKEESVAYTIFFENESPFQKLDLGINSSLSEYSLFENSRKEYVNLTLSPVVKGSSYKRAEDLFNHLFLDCYIGSLRYLKHRLREEVWTSYRFYKAFIEQYITLRTSISNPTVEDYKFIDKSIGNEIKDLLFVHNENVMSSRYFTYLSDFHKRIESKLTRRNVRFAQTVLEQWSQHIGTRE